LRTDENNTVRRYRADRNYPELRQVANCRNCSRFTEQLTAVVLTAVDVAVTCIGKLVYIGGNLSGGGLCPGLRRLRLATLTVKQHLPSAKPSSPQRATQIRLRWGGVRHLRSPMAPQMSIEILERHGVTLRHVAAFSLRYLWS